MIDCRLYMERFEREVICKGFINKTFGEREEEIVPLKAGKKMGNMPLGDFLGKEFFFDKVLAINFYGYYKLSSKIFYVKKIGEKIFGDVRSIKAPVVHFNSIKIEAIKDLAPELIEGFPDFKKQIVNLRWKK